VNRVDEILHGQSVTRQVILSPPIQPRQPVPQQQTRRIELPQTYTTQVISEQQPAPISYQVPAPVMIPQTMMVPQANMFSPQDTNYLQLQLQQIITAIVNEIQQQINTRSLSPQEQMSLFSQIQGLQQLLQPQLGMTGQGILSQIQALQSMYPFSNMGVGNSNIGMGLPVDNQMQSTGYNQQQQFAPPMSIPVNNFAPPTSLPYGIPPPVSQPFYQQQSIQQPQPQPPVNDLLNNLQALGFLKSATVAPPPRPTPPTVHHRPVPPKAPIQKAPGSNVLAKKSRVGKDLWSSDMLKRRDESVIGELYFEFPLQCKNCGLRFGDRHKMDLHLDWHFVQNRKEKEKTRKAMSRSWFLPRDEWISAADIEEKAAVPFPFGDGAVVQEEKQQSVSVTADEKQTNCPKCGESFEQYWNSDQDEWMYRDCVSIDGIIYHQKCSMSTETEPIDLKPVVSSLVVTQSKLEPTVVLPISTTTVKSLTNPTPSIDEVIPAPVVDEMPPLEDHDENANLKKRPLEQEIDVTLPVEDSKRTKTTIEEAVVA